MPDFGLLYGDNDWFEPVGSSGDSFDKKTQIENGTFARYNLWSQDSDGYATLDLEGYAGNMFLNAASSSFSLNGTIQDLPASSAYLFGIGSDFFMGHWSSEYVSGGFGNDVIYGYGGNDVLDGGWGSDVLYGGGDNDVLRGGAGNDYLYGETGSDRIAGGSGADYMDGGAGIDLLDLTGETGAYSVDLQTGATGIAGESAFNFENVNGSAHGDTLRGSTADNVLHGLGGNDTIHGRDGDDMLTGGAGADRLFGGTGTDTLDGGYEDDRLYGEGDADLLEGGFGADSLYGGSGDDTLDGGFDADYLSGGSGDDVFVGSHGRDTAYGGTGDDTFDLGFDGGAYHGGSDSDTLTNETTAKEAALFQVDPMWWEAAKEFYLTFEIDLAEGTVLMGEVESTISSIENVRLTGSVDLIGSSAANRIEILGDDDSRIETGHGDDTVRGGGGDDWIDGGWGYDDLDGGAGFDTMDGSFYNGAWDFDMGTGVVDWGSVQERAVNFEHAITGAGDDRVIGSTKAERIETGHGDDTVRGGGGDDWIDGGWGLDDLDGGAGFDTMDGSFYNGAWDFDMGTGVVDWGSVQERAVNFEHAITGTGNDTVTGSDRNDRIETGAGRDMLWGGEGHDTLEAGAGIDALMGGAGHDVLDGGAGMDMLTGGAGNDTLTGGADSDTFIFTEADWGHDTIRDLQAEDVLDLRGAGITSLDQMDYLTADDGAQLNFGGSSIFLEGYHGDIEAQNIWFDLA